MSIAALVPDLQVLLALEPAEVGAVMLESLISLPPNEARSFSRHNHFRPDELLEYPRDQRLNAAKALSEGGNWVLREGLVAPHPDHQDTWYFVTRSGQALRTREHVQAYRRGSVLPKNLLHPVIAAKVEAPFIRGEYDTAVFQAFKEVEVAVRAAGGFADTDIGTDLMRKAFHETNGPPHHQLGGLQRQIDLPRRDFLEAGGTRGPHVLDLREPLCPEQLLGHLDRRLAEGRVLLHPEPRRLGRRLRSNQPWR
jgi:hypothetical protein